MLNERKQSNTHALEKRGESGAGRGAYRPGHGAVLCEGLRPALRRVHNPVQYAAGDAVLISGRDKVGPWGRVHLQRIAALIRPGRIEGHIRRYGCRLYIPRLLTGLHRPGLGRYPPGEAVPCTQRPAGSWISVAWRRWRQRAWWRASSLRR